MTIDRIRRRVFVVGCPRSGTTLLQSMLAAHPEVHSFPETHMIRNAVGDIHRREFGIARHPRGVTDRIKRWVKSTFKIAERGPAMQRIKKLLAEVDREDLLDDYIPVPYRLKTVISQQIDCLDRLAIDAQRVNWVEKSPPHVLYTDEIERYVPAAKIVHIVRSPENTIASCYDAAHRMSPWWNKEYRTLEGCVAAWVNCLMATRRVRSRPRHHVVRYEHLTAEPRSVLTGICRFLEMPFDESMIGDRADAANRVVNSYEVHKANVTGNIQVHRGKFDKIFDEAQRKEIFNLLEQRLPDWKSILEEVAPMPVTVPREESLNGDLKSPQGRRS